MDFFIILIVVVALFNLVGGLLRKEQQKQASTNRPGASPARFRVYYDDDEPDLFQEEPVAIAAAPEVKPAATVRQRQLPSQEKLPAIDAGTVTANVQRIFSDSDRLVAGFIFHEVMQPPRGLRARRRR